MNLSSFIRNKENNEEPHQDHQQNLIVKNLPGIDDIANYNCDFAYPPGNPPYKDTDIEICVICYNQFFQRKDKCPDFEINDLATKILSFSLHVESRRSDHLVVTIHACTSHQQSI